MFFYYYYYFNSNCHNIFALSYNKIRKKKTCGNFIEKISKNILCSIIIFVKYMK